MLVYITCTIQQGCRTGLTNLAPGLQVPPEGTPDKEVDLPSELNAPQPHLNRAQSITSAVDYQYFDVGIGQVAVENSQAHFKSSPQNQTLSYLILTPVDFGSGDVLSSVSRMERLESSHGVKLQKWTQQQEM